MRNPEDGMGSGRSAKIEAPMLSDKDEEKDMQEGGRKEGRVEMAPEGSDFKVLRIHKRKEQREKEGEGPSQWRGAFCLQTRLDSEKQKRIFKNENKIAFVINFTNPFLRKRGKGRLA